MHDFDYISPRTLAEAVDVLARHNGSARVLAGGTDLIDQIRTGRFAPALLVDVKKIAELNVLEVDASGLRLGAAVPCWRISGNERLARDYAALADSCRIIGGIQIQSRATVGGNLCNSGPAADTTPSLIALGAVAVIAGPGGAGPGGTGPGGVREVPVEAFCTGPGRNVLEPGELLVELRFPPRPQRAGSHYRRFIPRNEMDIAVVGAGASVVLDDAGERFASARVALAAVAPTPLFLEEAGELLAGRPVTEDVIRRAGEAARSAARPIDDMRGTVEFRRHVAGVLTERVLRAAVERARARRSGEGSVPD